VERLSPFLVGGPAFSGTTLLALQLNQPGMVCLDEPDFETPAQAHRGIPVLRRIFPNAALPTPPARALSHEEAFDFFKSCAEAVQPTALGFKTCNWSFVSFARLFHEVGLPVIIILRDIRDALVRPLPPWVTEESLNAAHRLVWENRGLATAVIRYEDLVAEPDATMAQVTRALGLAGAPRTSWNPNDVPKTMLKIDRHNLLQSGSISASRVGIWRQSGHRPSRTVTETARMMGYDA
jgi:hypothetical protein